MGQDNSFQPCYYANLLKITCYWNRIVFPREMMSTRKIILLTTPSAHICILKAFPHVREGSTFAEALKRINHPSRVTRGGKSAERCSSRERLSSLPSHVEDTAVSSLEVCKQPGW